MKTKNIETKRMKKDYLIVYNKRVIIEGPEGGVPIPFHTWNFGKIPVPVGFLLEIPVRVIEIPVNKKPFIYL